MKKSLLSASFLFASSAFGQTAVWQDLPNSYLQVMSLSRPDAVGTVVLLPGGSWTLGDRDPNTKIPKGENFLVRSIDKFYNQKFNIVLMDQPNTGMRDVYARTESNHVKDITNTVNFAKSKGKPVYAVGMSFGAISAVSYAVTDSNNISGIVLASPTIQRSTKLPAGINNLNIDLGKITAPVLIIGHVNDDCPSSKPEHHVLLSEKLKNSRRVDVKNISSGSRSVGYKCTAFSWHGFGDADVDAVNLISNWIKEN